MLDCSGACVNLEPQTRQPQTQPLKTLQEVLSWKPTQEQLLCSQKPTTKGYIRPTGPRTEPYTLVCHDFKGGYLEDRYLQGGRKEDAYYFCRWECVDVFVYFSHHFVTVPPLGWVRAAHKHGNMVLGTVITEWDDGAAVWSTVLSSRYTVQQLVSNLVAICKHHDFDGWLVNVENKIEESQVEALRGFMQLLTEESHQQLPGSKVLWYDSVTRTGELKWQDQLNDENSLFFDACDGIFLNYCWTPEKLAASKEVAMQKNRPFDVFVGIDVFGRGCPGGGGFNTREALHHARERSLSAAIFAPGWVLECLGPSDFDENDCRFWTKLHDLCPLSDGGGLPLSSAFCQGHGNAFFCMGQDVTGKSWYNMSLQQRQPERTRVYGFQDPSHLASQPSFNTCLSSAYLGGCSIELSAHLTMPLQTVSFRLFSIKATLDEALYCSYTYRENSDTPCDVFLVLTFGSGLLTRQAVMGSVSSLAQGQEKGLFSDTADEPAQSPEKGLCPDTADEPAQSPEKGLCPDTADEPAQRPEKGLFSDTADAEVSSPVSKKARTEPEVVYVSPLKEEELAPLKSSLWFHAKPGGGRTQGQGSGGTQGQEPWITRYFRVDMTKLMPGCSSRMTEERISIAISLSRPADSPPCSSPQSEGNCTSDVHGDTQRTSVLLGHLQVFREQDLKLQAPRVTNIRLEKLELLNLDDTTKAPGSNNSTDNSSNSAAADFLSEPSYIVRWDIDGNTGIDYFNIYLTSGDSPTLVGHSATMAFVTSIAAKFIRDDKVALTIQPVLSATGLPQALSKCSSKSLPLPKNV